MVYRKLYFQIIFRVILIVLTSIWFAFVFVGPFKVYTLIVVISLIIIQGYALVKLLNNFNHEVFYYFSSLKDTGSSTHFNLERAGRSELYQLINEVSTMISNARIDKEQQYQYLKFIVDTIPVGVIIVDNEGEVILANNSVNRLLSIKSIKNISHFDSISPILGRTIRNIDVGTKELVRVKIHGEYMKILIGLTDFKIGEEQIHLYTLQDVKRELDENEIRAWQKLVRVLNHELMNSITPITTLTLAIKKCLTDNDSIKRLDQIDSETLRDILKNADLIEERSKGLIQFINNYRNLTSIKKLEISEFQIDDLFQGVKHLFDNEIQLRKIEFSIDVNPINLSITADRKLIEQVLINLIKNAIEAFDLNAKSIIKLNAFSDSMGRSIITVADNGKGIDETLIDDIFIPFFTTKKEGSGIGLSFSKQVMRMHGGEIKVNSEQGRGSVFILSF